MACDPTTNLADAKCLLCLDNHQLNAVLVALICAGSYPCPVLSVLGGGDFEIAWQQPPVPFPERIEIYISDSPGGPFVFYAIGDTIDGQMAIFEQKYVRARFRDAHLPFWVSCYSNTVLTNDN